MQLKSRELKIEGATLMTIETQQELLERAAARHKLNFTELAKQLGISRQAISQFRYGSPMSTEVAMRLAKLTRDEPEYVVACVEHNKAQRLGRSDELEVWERMAKLTKR
jgi:predicted transcriptional regulator